MQCSQDKYRAPITSRQSAQDLSNFSYEPPPTDLISAHIFSPPFSIPKENRKEREGKECSGKSRLKTTTAHDTATPINSHIP
jgi:hypothetical protein